MIPLSVFLFMLLPAPSGILLAQTNALRLRLYKYDYLERHPELQTRSERKDIPWDELIREDKEILTTIGKAVEASPELRSKKKLIEAFIADVNTIEDVITEWNSYVSKQREEELNQIIKEERLNPEETRKFLENTFRYGEVKTVGTDIGKIMPPMSRFGSGNRTKKKQTIIEKIQRFFDKYCGIGETPKFTNSEDK